MSVQNQQKKKKLQPNDVRQSSVKFVESNDVHLMDVIVNVMEPINNKCSKLKRERTNIYLNIWQQWQSRKKKKKKKKKAPKPICRNDGVNYNGSRTTYTTVAHQSDSY